MAKRNSQLTELLVVAQDDYLTIVDTSAGQSKRVSVKNLTGLPDTGWIASGEAWTFSSFDSTTRTGVITVPTDATTKYTPGNRIRIAQSTGGTKFGIIHVVAATALTVFFPVGTTLNNEAINTPVWSPLDSPVGFDKNPELWTLVTRKTTRTTQAATPNVFYNIGGNLPVGAGKWLLGATDIGLITTSPAGYMGFTTVLSTANTGTGGIIQDTRARSAIMSTASSEVDDQYYVNNVPFSTAAAATIYMNRAASSGSGMTLYSEQTADFYANGSNYIKALSAYL